jgi:Leucine-rich repeat (LRR) protein
MHRLLFVLPLVFAFSAKAQLLSQTELDTVRTYHSLASALKHPDSVFRLDLSHRKLREVPEDIRKLKNLNALDLGRNKLKELPGWMNELQYMQEFSAGKNKFTAIPNAVCQWKHLKRLDMHQNQIEGLPKCIGGLKELFSLDLWSNDLSDFPDEISAMRSLRFLDLRAIAFKQDEIDRISSLLPSVKIFFSQPCNCGE